MDHYTFQPGSRTIVIGTNTRNWYFNIAKNGAAIQTTPSTTRGASDRQPKIATFPDPHSGHLKGIAKGKTTAHWDYGNKHQCSAEVVVN